MQLGPEDVSLLERCPHFRGCYVQASMELGLCKSLLQTYPPFRGYRDFNESVPIFLKVLHVHVPHCMYRLQWRRYNMTVYVHFTCSCSTITTRMYTVLLIEIVCKTAYCHGLPVSGSLSSYLERQGPSVFPPCRCPVVPT